MSYDENVQRNQDRAACAKAIMEEHYSADPDSALVDLLADILHAEGEENVRSAFNMALIHYNEELDVSGEGY